MQEAALEDPESPIETYSSNLHILDPVGDGLQVTCMTTDDWHQVQWLDPVLGIVIVRMQDGTLSQCPLRLTNPQALAVPLRMLPSQTEVGMLYRKILPGESQETPFQLVLPAAHQETTLRGCHSEVSHLDLEMMLDLMCNHFFWPKMVMQARENVKKCHLCITFKVKQQRAPMENIMTTHPLELVNINYLCLEPRKGKKDNILVVMDHFTHYAQACHSIPDGPDNSQGPLGQFHCSLWITGENPLRPGEEF